MSKFRADIQAELNVSGCRQGVAFFKDIFLMDYWNEDEGMRFLSGISLFNQASVKADFDSLTTLEFETYSQPEDENILLAFKYVWHRLKILWLSGSHEKLNPPTYYIDWAISKNHQIPWLDFAIKEGFYKPKQLAGTDKPLSNTERETLLVIIAALAKEAKVDIAKISKAGDLIANMTQLIGAPIGATTIETHLKKINQAIVNRAK